MEDIEIDENLIPGYSTSYTSKRLGISVDGLKALVRRGEIEAHLRGCRLKFTIAAIKKYEEDMRFKPEGSEEVLTHIKKLDVEPLKT